MTCDRTKPTCIPTVARCGQTASARARAESLHRSLSTGTRRELLRIARRFLIYRRLEGLQSSVAINQDLIAKAHSLGANRSSNPRAEPHSDEAESESDSSPRDHHALPELHLGHSSLVWVHKRALGGLRKHQTSLDSDGNYVKALNQTWCGGVG